MEVILMQDLRHSGKRGEIIDVKAGFARNYLVPQGLALPATPGNIKYFEQKRTKINAAHVKEREAAAEIAAQLAGISLSIAKRVSEAESLYGSVTAAEIAELLEAKGFVVDRRRIDLEGGIKTLGDHQVRIDLHPEVTAEVNVEVKAEE
jgi:large subunit ribosomal protein L9